MPGFGEHLDNAFRQGVGAEGRDAVEAKRDKQEFPGQESPLDFLFQKRIRPQEMGNVLEEPSAFRLVLTPRLAPHGLEGSTKVHC